MPYEWLPPRDGETRLHLWPYRSLPRRGFVWFIGGTAALPIWIDFMREALRDSPVKQRPLPTGLVSVRIDPDTGLVDLDQNQ